VINNHCAACRDLQSSTSDELPAATCDFKALSLWGSITRRKGAGFGQLAASMSSQSPIDDSSRFSPIGDDDHAGYLWIVTTLGIIYSGLAAALRGHIKWGLLGSDDYCIALATVSNF
jgi:hypothetical protein